MKIDKFFMRFLSFFCKPPPLEGNTFMKPPPKKNQGYGLDSAHKRSQLRWIPLCYFLQLGLEI
jgi:hypothetical protein